MTSVPSAEPRRVEPDRSRPQRRGYITTYGEGRTCAEAGCETTLSRYNDSRLCWRHTDERAHGDRRPLS